MAIKVSGTTVIDDDRRLVNHRLTTQSIDSNTNASAGVLYVANSYVVLTLPSSPTAGDQVGFNNQSNVITSNIAGNGSNINGLDQELTVDVAYASMTLIYTDANMGWVII